MKKLIAVVFIFVATLVVAAVRFSPLCELGAVDKYDNNEAVHTYDGLCYPAVGVYRTDFIGGEAEMRDALDRMEARTVKETSAGGALIVYAYSDRVCTAALETADGEKYNVMAAAGNGRVSIGTPLLQGSY